MTCPVGGERFEAFITGIYSTSGSRPDGREYSYWFSEVRYLDDDSTG